MPIRKRFTNELEARVAYQKDVQLVEALRVIYMTLKTFPRARARMEKEWASYSNLAEARGHKPGEYFARNIHKVVTSVERFRK